MAESNYDDFIDRVIEAEFMVEMLREGGETEELIDAEFDLMIAQQELEGVQEWIDEEAYSIYQDIDDDSWLYDLDVDLDDTDDEEDEY